VEREGHKGVWRGFRLWPHTPTDIEVIDVDEVPETELQDLMALPKDERPAYVYEIGPSIDNPTAPRRLARKPSVVGRNAFASMERDGRLSINPIDRPAAALPADIQAEIKRRDVEISDLRQQLENARAEAASLRGSKAKPAAAADDDDDDDDDEDAGLRVSELETENLTQKTRIAELERELVTARTAVTPAPSAPPEEKAPPVPTVAQPAAPLVPATPAPADTGKPAGKKR
jgi:hypothetical protein